MTSSPLDNIKFMNHNFLVINLERSIFSTWQNSILNANLMALQSKSDFVRSPAGNSVTEQFIQIFKKQSLWIEIFETV